MAGSLWGTTPRQSIESACGRLGTGIVIRDCLALLGDADADPSLVEALGGPTAPRMLDAPPGQRYWLRVWGARGLLWALSMPDAPPADEPWIVEPLLGALGDQHWRVREMAIRVVARYRLDEAQPAIAALLTDETLRVRTAAARALRVLMP
ncbi:MAG TPA: HEAT repeat domain-containing protein [Actinoplanes sp.]|nr:HEAT repeat domain-containing protein [Actinoplanes sp.]